MTAPKLSSSRPAEAALQALARSPAQRGAVFTDELLDDVVAEARNASEHAPDGHLAVVDDPNGRTVGPCESPVLGELPKDGGQVGVGVAHDRCSERAQVGGRAHRTEIAARGRTPRLAQVTVEASTGGDGAASRQRS